MSAAVSITCKFHLINCGGADNIVPNQQRSVTWIVPTRGNKVCVGDSIVGIAHVSLGHCCKVLETDVVAYMNNKRFVTRGKGHRTASLYELLK